jgi:hypothetical protein
MSVANTQHTKAFDAILAELAKPFDPAVVEFKPGAVAKSSNRALALAYVDARAYETRLDEADSAWSNAYLREYPEGRVVVTCTLTVGGVTRQAIGECLVLTANGAEENAATSAEAQAFKRACAKFSLGRYLYAVPQVWADYDPARRAFTPAALDALREMLRTGKLPPNGAPADAQGHAGGAPQGASGGNGGGNGNGGNPGNPQGASSGSAANGTAGNGTAAGGVAAGGELAAMEVKFGKFKGQTLGQVLAQEPSYVKWLSENAQFAPLKAAAAALLTPALPAGIPAPTADAPF